MALDQYDARNANIAHLSGQAALDDIMVRQGYRSGSVGSSSNQTLSKTAPSTTLDSRIETAEVQSNEARSLATRLTALADRVAGEPKEMANTGAGSQEPKAMLAPPKLSRLGDAQELLGNQLARIAEALRRLEGEL
jgi:cell division septum initiation protein DivIVA